jgi:2-oxoglutarate dehydrogenase E2 component (dihydrolipoamide succinyltransferase)
MIVDIKIPSPGESITEVEISRWLVGDGEYVEKDHEIAEVESDKATLPLIASQSGKIKILIGENKTIKVGAVACTIDTSEIKQSGQKKAEKKEDLPKISSEISKQTTESLIITKNSEVKTSKEDKQIGSVQNEHIKVTPLARKVMEDNSLVVDDILNGLKKISTKEVNLVINSKTPVTQTPRKISTDREEKRERMSQLRRKLSKRLVAVKNETAMLTTFNEVDMSQIITLRKKFQKQFTETHGLKLGFMSFFVKASTEALTLFPKINSQIDGEEFITPAFVDIAIAVQTDKGLMVPVLRDTQLMSIAQIEKSISLLADKARTFKLSIEEMTGGTFTITNGGVFGSMLSTPILNPPQSAILGMHNITERPVAVNGKVEIRPIMYVALSYDHRIIDGKDSVSFLVKVKELLEAPHEMLFNGEDQEKILLGL